MLLQEQKGVPFSLNSPNNHNGFVGGGWAVKLCGCVGKGSQTQCNCRETTRCRWLLLPSIPFALPSCAQRNTLPISKEVRAASPNMLVVSQRGRGPVAAAAAYFESVRATMSRAGCWGWVPRSQDRSCRSKGNGKGWPLGLGNSVLAG